jgi:hypothetical protein
MRSARYVLFVMVCLAVAAVAAEAQVRGMGRINGVVVDDGGAPIDGVKVRTATAGGDVIECDTDAKGRWALGGIGRGDWAVTVLKPGFTAKRLKVTVEREIDRSQEIKITLAKGA